MYDNWNNDSMSQFNLLLHAINYDSRNFVFTKKGFTASYLTKWNEMSITDVRVLLKLMQLGLLIKN